MSDRYRQQPTLNQFELDEIGVLGEFKVNFDVFSMLPRSDRDARRRHSIRFDNTPNERQAVFCLRVRDCHQLYDGHDSLGALRMIRHLSPKDCK